MSFSRLVFPFFGIVILVGTSTQAYAQTEEPVHCRCDRLIESLPVFRQIQIPQTAALSLDESGRSASIRDRHIETQVAHTLDALGLSPRDPCTRTVAHALFSQLGSTVQYHARLDFHPQGPVFVPGDNLDASLWIWDTTDRVVRAQSNCYTIVASYDEQDACFHSQPGTNRELAHQWISTHTDAEIAANIFPVDYRNSLAIIHPESAARVLRAWDAGMMQDTWNGALQAIREFQRNTPMTTDEKIFLLRIIGHQMDIGYDEDRNNRVHGHGRGGISDERLFQSIRHNWGTSNDQPLSVLGVCRDFAVVQAELAEALGFRNVHIVTYSTPGSLHVVTLAELPDRPGSFIRTSYGHATLREGVDGARLLYAGYGDGAQDAGMQYWIHDAHGRPVGHQLSAIGQLLTEAAGGDVRDWDITARPQQSILMAQGSLPTRNSGRVEIRGGLGQDAVGTSLTFGSMSFRYRPGTRAPGSLSLLAGYAVTPGSRAGIDTSTATAALYLDWTQRLRSRSHLLTRPSARIPARLRLESNFELALYPGIALATPEYIDDGLTYHTGTNHPQLIPSGVARLRGEAQVTLGTDTTPVRGDLRAGIQGGFGLCDETDLQSICLYFQNLYYDAQLRGDLAGALDWYLAMRGTHGPLGHRGNYSAGVAGRNFALETGFSGGLTRGTSMIQDGTQRQLRLSGSILPNRHFSLGVNLRIPFPGMGYPAGHRPTPSGNLSVGVHY